MKDLKSRVADMEGQTRLPAGISLLEGKVQELEERLRSEERCAHTSTHAMCAHVITQTVVCRGISKLLHIFFIEFV